MGTSSLFAWPMGATRARLTRVLLFDDGLTLTRRSICHRCSEENEDFLDVAFDELNFLAEDVEAEGGRAVNGHSLMALLEPVVLLDVMEVIASDDDGSGHFAVDDNTLEDSSTDGNVAGEGALLVNVSFLDGGLGGLEAKSNFFVESNSVGRLLGHHFLGGKEYALLLLEGFFSL